ncbi:MAG: zinc ribbon domain-containing protein [Chloroflexi bacterium]|nr:zinc ribbon domain-containing protein [Chloroflexota bacterium]
MAHNATDAMWAASSREILQPVATAPALAAVQACSNCGISLSATARFCRRCGTPQG